MIKSYIRVNKDGEPVWTFKVTGGWDIFRLAFSLIHAQVEFCREGDRAYGYLRRHLGRERFAALDKHLTGGRINELGYGKRRGGL